METITKEDNYYERIMGMNLNTSVDDVLDILHYVETYNRYWDIFYNNLYVLVEKEKYLKAKFNAEPKLYPRLNIQAKEMLRTLFIQNLNEYSGQEKNMIASELDLLGYEKVIDQRCQRFFDKCEFENRQTFDLDEDKCHAYFNDVGWSDLTSKKFVVKVSDSSRLHLCPWEKRREDKTIVVKNLQNRVDTDRDYYFVQSNAVCSGGAIRRYAIDRNTGECIRISSKLEFFPEYSFGYFVKKFWEERNKRFHYNFYNKNFKKLYVIHEVLAMFTDYRLELFVAYKTDRTVEIYNKDLKLVNKLDFKVNYGDYNITLVNDGIMTLYSSNKKRIIYYDYINMREIDSFKYYGDAERYFAYSEGVYNCVDDNGHFCYKNLDREIVIDPIFYIARPFLGNTAVATVYDTAERVFVDRTGKCTPESKVLDEMYQGKTMYYGTEDLGNAYSYLEDRDKRRYLYYAGDFKIGKYHLMYHPSPIHWKTNKGCIVTQDDYVASIDTPIVEIKFEGKNKCFEKVNPMD